MPEKDKNKENNENHIELIFVIGGKPRTIPKVNVHQKLSVPATEALKLSNNLPANPLDRWQLMYQNNEVSAESTIEDLKLPNMAEVYMNIRDAKGGN
jgi:hypothetical protein